MQLCADAFKYRIPTCLRSLGISSALLPIVKPTSIVSIVEWLFAGLRNVPTSTTTAESKRAYAASTITTTAAFSFWEQWATAWAPIAPNSVTHTQTRTASLPPMMLTPAQAPSSRPSHHRPPKAPTAKSASSHSAMSGSRLCHVGTGASVRRAPTRWNVRVVVVPSAAQPFRWSCVCSDKLQDLNKVLIYCATVCFVYLLYVLSAVIDY